MSLDIGDTLLTKHLSWMVLYAVKQEIALLQQFLSVLPMKQKVRRCSSALTEIKKWQTNTELSDCCQYSGKATWNNTAENIEPPENHSAGPDRTKKHST